MLRLHNSETRAYTSLDEQYRAYSGVFRSAPSGEHACSDPVYGTPGVLSRQALAGGSARCQATTPVPEGGTGGTTSGTSLHEAGRGAASAGRRNPGASGGAGLVLTRVYFALHSAPSASPSTAPVTADWSPARGSTTGCISSSTWRMPSARCVLPAPATRMPWRTPSLPSANSGPSSSGTRNTSPPGGGRSATPTRTPLPANPRVVGRVLPRTEG